MRGGEGGEESGKKEKYRCMLQYATVYVPV